ncbi:MAG: glutathione S-transferase family protein [Ferrovibrio sp.]|uniref:glutathione S-transferase family protein n=1 Tax=Ferrovibrio sp. TaxID=1917215 RepID=UPI003919D87A
MLKILGKVSSINVRKVLWACAEMGVPYAREDWGAGFRSTDDLAFAALNPNRLVPVVIDGDFVLWESNTILRWLAAREERFDLLPRADAQHARARARVEQWIDWQATEFNAAWRYAFLALVRRAPGFDDAGQIAASLQSWAGMLAIVEAQLQKTGGHIAAQAFTLADIPVGLGVHRWMLTPIEQFGEAAGFTRPAFPHVQAYYDRLRARPAFQSHGSLGVA